ncbi:MAG: C4-type zinc ribbon domain-containing protein, partial [Phycisphaerae bacterium]|nr:C4-type zinc ribbon domain-containing protein [Phycisphaerae bacterium]
HIMELLRDIEVDEAECEKIQNQIDQQKQILEQSRKEAELLATKYEAEVEEIQIEWNQVAQTITTDPLEIFKRVSETYDGEALAVIDRQDGRTEAYTCGGCFMGITTESVNLLMTKDDIIRCPNCTRILVLGGDKHI